jgi:hypothetical protein
MQSLEGFQRSFIEMLNGAPVPCFKGTPIQLDQTCVLHRSSFKHNLRNALASTYAHVLTLVGERYFTQLAFLYIRHYPSRSGDLNEYGADFPFFLEAYLPHFPSGDTLHYLADVARFDWAIHRATLEKSSREGALQGLSELTEHAIGSVTMCLNPAVSIIESTYPLREICKVDESGGTCQLDQGGEVLMINKVDSSIWVKAIPSYVAGFLSLWAAHLFLGTALEQFHSQYPDVSIAGLFQELDSLCAINSLEVWG